MERSKNGKAQRKGLDPTSLIPNGCIDSIWPDGVSVGANCILSSCKILSHDASLLPTTGRYRFARTSIGDSCFIGLHAIILPGVTIGDRCVIGAGAVVTKDIPDGSVAAGVPAVVIGRTDDLSEDGYSAADSPWRTGPYGDITDPAVIQWSMTIKDQI